MDLTVERSAALAAISRAVRIVERKQIIPILGNVVVKADGKSVVIRATDLDMEATETIPAEVSKPGEITVPADRFESIFRNADAGAQVSLRMEDGDFRMKVQSGRSRFNLPTIPAVSFPVFLADNLETTFSMPAKTLSDMLDRVAWGVDTNDKASPKGVTYFASVEDQIHAVSLTGAGGALRMEPKPEGVEFAAMLTPKLVGRITSWLADKDGDATISVSDTKIRIEHEGGVLVSKLFEAGSYFNYKILLGIERALWAKIDQEALKLAIMRVLAVSVDAVGVIYMTFTEGNVKLWVRGESDGAEEISCEYSGPEITLKLKGELLNKSLRTLQGDIVEFGFMDEAALKASGQKSQPNDAAVVVRAPVDDTLTFTLGQMAV